MKATTILSLLAFALSAHAQITEISPEEFEEITEWNETTFPEIPDCANTCLNSSSGEESDKLIPPCAMTDQEDEDAEMKGYNNAMACLCADRIYQAHQLECVLKTCKGKDVQESFDYQLSIMYAMCAVYTPQRWPEPKAVLSELCLADDVPKGINIPDIKAIFKDAPKILNEYKFADAWPEQTATTWAPNGTPIPETREPLECQADTGDDDASDGDEEEDGASVTSGTKSASGPEETGAAGAEESDDKPAGKEDKEGAAAGGAKIGAFMMAVVGLVGGLAVAL